MPTNSSDDRYVHGFHDSVLRSHRWRTADNSAAYLLPRLRPDAHVLDVGCGPGTITVDLAGRVPEGWVVGIDSSPSVLAEAQALAVPDGRRNVRFAVGDVFRLDFDEATFDVVHAHQVLQHLGDPIAALAEMRRVCRPGGVVAARDADYGGMFWYPESEEMSRWLSLYRTVARGAGGNPDGGRRLPSWAIAAGFSQVDVSASTWCFATPDERRWWGGLWAERVTHSRFAEQAVEQRLATGEDLRRLADGWRRWIEHDDAVFFLVHGEVLCTP